MALLCGLEKSSWRCPQLHKQDNKRMKTRQIFIATLCKLLLPLALLASQAGHGATYKIATDIQANGTAGKLLAEFAQRVEARTQGRVKFKLFQGGVLGDQLQYFQHVQRGVIDIGLINSASLESVIPTFGVMNMPYLFRSADEYKQVMSQPRFRQALFESSRKHRFAFIGFISSDFRSIYSVKKLHGIADLSGQRLRTISSPTYVEMLRRFGATPAIISFGELYSAMQQGVVDGAEGGIAGLYEAKFCELAKQVLLTEHTRLTDFVISSMAFEQKVGPADYQIVSEEFAAISDKSIAYAEQNEARAKEILVRDFAVQFTAVDKAPLIAAVAPLYQQALDDIDKRRLLEAIFSIEQRQLPTP